jgi:hypothetical protein
LDHKSKRHKKNNSNGNEIYIKKKAGYTWADYKANTEIAKELNVKPVLDKKQEYRRNCLQHINRMTHNKLPRILKNYRPTGRRN